ncbi:binding-protein-dependent transport systems inner membrane component [Alkaliphilus metalliredigens QYMF]|uniref:Binding-protein-dependent transport systems inner membrane component n=1 Tax=Alkaliphilus metalliredigens (strain QYMF) TaxID=293826 RepID=A6TPC5_ALKMQ|nr:ABC transporter permease [Alkaliphilus metalliredigens]ABR48043.1 binding-protein-dependent transport systems inner membrane component [Alkaliphilus metalliredigens QYMF]
MQTTKKLSKTTKEMKAPIVPAVKSRASRSQWAEVWLRLKKSKAAMLGLTMLIILLLTAIFANYIAPYSYSEQNLTMTREAPGATYTTTNEAGEEITRRYILGTDHNGRDILSRIIYGARTSIQVGFIAIAFAVVIGGAIGSIAGYYGGRLDNLIMRCIDVLLAIPPILLAIAIVSAFGGSLVNVMIAIGIGNTPRMARLVRGSVMSVRENEYIESAKALGASDARIIFNEIIPNALAPIIVQGTLNVASAIIAAAGLSYIGLGAPPPTPEWGSMLSSGQNYIRTAWWMSVFPGLAIFITVLSLNLLGDGLRDALDPRLKQ